MDSEEQYKFWNYSKILLNYLDKLQQELKQQKMTYDKLFEDYNERVQEIIKLEKENELNKRLNAESINYETEANALKGNFKREKENALNELKKFKNDCYDEAYPIKKLNKEKKVTVILTTHDMADIEALAKRIILIDDIEKCSLNATAKKQLIEDLKKEFSRIIITTPEVNELHIITENVRLYDDFKSYNIKPFGYYKRNCLIEKWIS